MEKKNHIELSNDERALLNDDPLPVDDEDISADDDFANFHTLSPEEKKWALIQLALDREAKLVDSFNRGE